MSDVHTRPLDRYTSQITIGVLAFVSAVLSIGIYEWSGEWPAGLGGLEPVFFVLLGVVLIAYSLVTQL
jgi:hypothetical protein